MIGEPDMTYLAAQATAVSAIILLIAYLFGVAFGVFGIVVFESRRESSRMSLLEQASGPLSVGLRMICGAFACNGGYASSLSAVSARPSRGWGRHP
jgi:hypothetical protein